ncbi:MAG: hypothetical protein Q8N77_03205 [Nanoarchaeota archaeon]|nr:hypothetical protein [Nanoarchaeota archaeon]
MKIPKLFVPEKDLEGEVKRLLEKEINPSDVQLKYSKFEVIHASTYAEGIAKLKEQSRKPFTFSENIEARIADYEANGKDAELFKTFLDSVTGIAYKAHSTKFKLILRSDRLENIPQDFNQGFITINYNTELGIEFDSKKGKYNKALTREEAKNHEFWLAAMGNDEGKLVEYVDIWFDKRRVKEGMGVYLRENTSQDELRAVVLNYGDFSSYTNGSSNLGGFARFVSDAQ